MIYNVSLTLAQVERLLAEMKSSESTFAFLSQSDISGRQQYLQVNLTQGHDLLGEVIIRSIERDGSLR